MNYVGHWLAIRSYKHDGSVHRTWDRGLILENNDDFVVVFSKKAKVTEGNGRCWFTKEPAITIFSKKDWWNVIAMFKKDGICFYCNIASPSIIEDEYIKYVDYDLDVKLYPNNIIRTLDEKEYKYNKKKYLYSEDLDKVLRYQNDQIINMMQNKSFPFDENKIKEYYEQGLAILGK